MKVLNTERQFRRWAAQQGFDGILSVKPRTAPEMIDMSPREVRERQARWYSEHSPKEYPCVAYDFVTSFQFEESEPRFLYAKDLHALLRAMGLDVRSLVLSVLPVNWQDDEAWPAVVHVLDLKAEASAMALPLAQRLLKGS